MKTALSVLFFVTCLQPIAESQIPLLNSYPSAKATVYLDFDGELVKGTSWNWNGEINAQPAQLSPVAITEIFNRVAEDFRIFNLDITTDPTVFLAAPMNQRMRIIVTPSSNWYGSAGGVSFVESFTWGDDTPAWVFSQLLGNNIKYIAEACSHEAGHTLGLQHQSTYDASCKKIAEYGAGRGTGEIGWAPIMGVGYYKNLTTWYYGRSAVGCNYLQDDISTIASINGFGLRSDDFGDTKEDAAEVNISGSGFNLSGIINTADDRDVFKLVLPVKLNLSLLAVPQNVGLSNAGADVDIRISLLNENSDTIGRYNPTDLLNAGIDTLLSAGTYYLISEGVGNLNLNDYGSVGHYTLSGLLNFPLPVHYLKLRGSVNHDRHYLSWSMQSDEAVGEFEIESSNNGSVFQKLLTVNPNQFFIYYQPVSRGKIFYRVKAITGAERNAYYSNVISMASEWKERIGYVINSVSNGDIKLTATEGCDYQLIMPNGQLISAGKVTKGLNKIIAPDNVKGLILLRLIDENEVWTEKIIQQ